MLRFRLPYFYDGSQNIFILKAAHFINAPFFLQDAAIQYATLKLVLNRNL